MSSDLRLWTRCDHCGREFGDHLMPDSKCPQGDGYFFRSIFSEASPVGGFEPNGDNR
jgi:hypothetical protein